MEGFELAYVNAADGIELDVQLSEDGRNVVMHDDTLNRTTTCDGPVGEHTLAELESCALVNGEPIRTLGDVLALTEGWFGLWFVEIKVPDGRPAELTIAQTDEAIDAVLASGYSERVVVISYDDTSLHRISERKGEGVIGGWDDTSGRSISEASRHDLEWVLMPIRVLEPWMGDITRGLGKDLAVYSINTPADFVSATEGGAQAVMTDSITTIAAMLE